MVRISCGQERGRAAVRAVLLVAAAVCAWPLGGPAWLAGLVPALSPFGALLSAAAGVFSLWLLGAGAVALASVFVPRVFCRWVCPVGTCRDAVAYRAKPRAWVGRAPRIGLALVAVGVGAALAGYPLFGWLDPLVLFNAAFGAARRGLTARDWAAAAGLPLLLVFSRLAPGLWCGRLCPLGALQDLLRAPLRFRGSSSGARGAEGAALSRRVFLGLGLGAGYRLALPPSRGAEAEVIRPPASGTPARFTRLCVRCGACVRACPNGLLKFGGVGAGWAGVLAPEVCFEDSYCPASCTACGEACPTGAIAKFTPAQKGASPMGVARVDDEACLLGLSRECGACVAACPHKALDLLWDPVRLSGRVVVHPQACTGCGYCEYVCPTSPRAIRIKAIRGATIRNGG